jgi:hypothetical protein
MIFDVNIAVGSYPSRRERFADPDSEFDYLQRNGIVGGFVRSLAAPFSADIYAANKDMIHNCAKHSTFLPAPAVRPGYEKWREIKSRAVTLYPGFHGYSLLESSTIEMASVLARQGKTLLVVMREEDERGQNPLCKIPQIPVSTLNEFAMCLDGAAIIAINIYFNEIIQCTASNLFCDFAAAEALDTLQQLQKKFPFERLLFGSNTPLFYTTGALAKIRDSALDLSIIEMIQAGNIRRILNGKA